MDIKPGDVVSMSHDPERASVKGLVLESDVDTICVKLIPCAESPGDPTGGDVAIRFESDNIVYVARCTVLSTEPDQRLLRLEIQTIEVLINKRTSERFSVFLNVDLALEDASVFHPGVVINISFAGMLVSSEEDFPLYQKLRVKLEVPTGEISAGAVVVRKVKEGDLYQYGLKIVYMDSVTPTTMKRYLASLKRACEHSLTRNRNG